MPFNYIRNMNNKYCEHKYSLQTNCEMILDDMLSDYGIRHAVMGLNNEYYLYIYTDIHENIPQIVLDVLHSNNSIHIYTHTVNESEYLLNYTKQTKPVYTDHFTVIPNHIEDYQDKYPLIINPGISFGTGSHETTRLMLNMMNTIDFRGKSVLDIGCGSCILSIAAELYGSTDITALDNDEHSYYSCIENNALNKCTHISTIIGNIDTIRDISFDILLLNMLPQNFKPFFEHVSDYIDKNSILILSGFTDAEDIGNFVLDNKYNIKEKMTLNDWHCFLLQQ